jgi:ankyrin repeat protein
MEEDPEIHQAFPYKTEAQTLALLRGRLPAEANALNEDHRSVLQYACMWSTDTVVQLLLDHGATVNGMDDFGYTAIHDALVNLTERRDAVFSLILAHGADPNVAQGPFKENVLHSAIYRGREATAMELLEHGADWRIVNCRGETTLHLAADAGMKRVTAWLLAAGAGPGARDECGRTPLHAAAAANKAGCVHLLLVAGADPGALEEEGRTPLAIAVGRKTRARLRKVDIVGAYGKEPVGF